VVLEMQTIEHVMLEGEVIRYELIVHHSDVRGDRVGRSSAGTYAKQGQQTQRCESESRVPSPG
jgi:hypothetical protein